MAAYNWIEIESLCPVCRRQAVIRAQAHIAASFDGDDSGRFCDRTYRLGQRMPWFARSHRNYADWQLDPDSPAEESDAREACYSECTACGAELFVVIQFREFVPSKVLALGPEDEWPDAYPR